MEFVDGAAVLLCHGRLIAGEEAMLLDAVTEAEPGTSLILDLAMVEDVDASGLGTLVEIHRISEIRGVDLSMVNLRPSVEQMIYLTGLHGVLPIAGQRHLCRAAC
jgi:anti-anti-sigma factor